MSKCIIYDWDDTLMFTYFIFNTEYGKTLELVRAQNKFKTVGDYFQLSEAEVSPSLGDERPQQKTTKDQAFFNRYILELDKVSTILLRKSKEIGKVLIVTNALEGWVEESARFYLPNVSNELRNIEILSARTTFQPIYPEFINKNFKLWKYKMFQHIINNNKNNDFYSIGDSDAEFNAMIDIKQENPTINISIIKFKFEPTLQYLKLEIEKCTKIIQNLKNNSVIHMEKELKKNIEGFVQSGGNYLIQNFNKIIWFNHCY
jgi:hypothetical protein